MWKCPECGREFKNINQDHYCSKTDSIDEYIEKQPEEVRGFLKNVRNAIREAVPEAEERISWAMPTFWKGENLIHFASFKKHMGLFPGTEAIEKFSEELSDYKTSKGTIQFPYNREPDLELIKRIAIWREKRCEEQKGCKTEYHSPRHEMPEYVREGLIKRNLMDSYEIRPPYQKNGYLAWILSAKTEATRNKRCSIMYDELERKEGYMGRPYRVTEK